MEEIKRLEKENTDLKLSLYHVMSLLRETSMRNRIAFPENEQDDKWFEEGMRFNDSGDFMERLFNTLELGRKGELPQ